MFNVVYALFFVGFQLALHASEKIVTAASTRSINFFDKFQTAI